LELQFSLEKEYFKAVEMLLSEGYSVDSKDEEGKTTLAWDLRNKK
jgi:hypothetical protein